MTLGIRAVCAVYYYTECRHHRYLRKNRFIKFCYLPATSTASSKGIFVAATNSANETNKAGGTCH